MTFSRYRKPLAAFALAAATFDPAPAAAFSSCLTNFVQCLRILSEAEIWWGQSLGEAQCYLDLVACLSRRIP